MRVRQGSDHLNHVSTTVGGAPFTNPADCVSDGADAHAPGRLPPTTMTRRGIRPRYRSGRGSGRPASCAAAVAERCRGGGRRPARRRKTAAPRMIETVLIDSNHT